MTNFKTPWDNPEAFEEMFLQDVIESGADTSSCNLWDGNEKWISKTIDPAGKPSARGKVMCLLSGVCMRAYALDHIVYLEKVGG